MTSEESHYGGYYIQYTLLGIAAAVIYSLDASELLNAVAIFVFTMCVFFVMILIIYSLGARRVRMAELESVGGYGAENMPGIESRSLAPKLSHEGRYSPQVLYLGIHSQSFINHKSVAVIGSGSVGAHVAELLARAGVGTITLMDPRRDERNTLATHRAGIVEERLQRINSSIHVQAHLVNLHDRNVNLIAGDLVIDCTDDFETKERINRISLTQGIPWILCSVHGDAGFLKVIRKGTPCLMCFSDALDRNPGQSTEPVTAHFAASLIVSEALKVLSHRDPDKNLIGFNTSELTIKMIPVNRNRHCSACGALLNRA
jgi:molybdopterin/thiamine biosynthesis adenylyltransferase